MDQPGEIKPKKVRKPRKPKTPTILKIETGNFIVYFN